MVKTKAHTKLLDEASKKQISEAIAQAEKLTAGEIVVQVIPRSDSYRTNNVLWVFSLAIVATMGFAIWHRGNLVQDLSHLILIQICGMILGLILSSLPFLSRLTLSEKEMRIKVHRECLANFLAQGLHQTEHHTGILIFISEFERRVEILADSGIHEKMSDTYWEEEVRNIIGGVKQGNAASSLIAAIERIGQKLAHHFPPSPIQINELSNEVREGDRKLD